MTDGCHADVLEIIPRELRKHQPIDLVITERGLVPLEAQVPQPRRYAHQAPPSSSSSALASLRSCVSKPSVNQPYTGASSLRASTRRPWSRRSRARLTAARSSQAWPPVPA